MKIFPIRRHSEGLKRVPEHSHAICLLLSPIKRKQDTCKKEIGFKIFTNMIRRRKIEQCYVQSTRVCRDVQCTRLYLDRFTGIGIDVFFLLDIAAELFAKDAEVIDKLRPHISAVLRVTETKHLKDASAKEKSIYGKLAKEHRVASLPAYRVLSISRGEHLKFLKCEVVLNEDRLRRVFKDAVAERWAKSDWSENVKMMDAAMTLSFDTFVVPLLKRETRAKLADQAEEQAIDDFSKNLKHLLLSPPIRGTAILGVDPGFTHGCKLAVVSKTGSVLDTCTLYPKFYDEDPTRDPHATVLLKLLFKHQCKVSHFLFRDLFLA